MRKLQTLGKKAFTLTELIIVIAVLIILSAITIPTVSGVVSRANESADIANAKSIEGAIKYAIASKEASSDTADTNVEAALRLSGMSESVLTARRNGYSFYYKNTNGEVEVAGANPGTGYVLLSGDSPMKYVPGAGWRIEEVSGGGGGSGSGEGGGESGGEINPAYSVSISGQESSQINQSITLTATGTSSQASDILTYVWTILSGEANSEDTDNNDSYTITTGSTAGSVVVEVTLYANGVSTGETDTHTIAVENAPSSYSVSIIAGPTTATTGEAVSFTASGTSSNASDILSYQWSFTGSAIKNGTDTGNTFNLTMGKAPGPVTVTVVLMVNGSLTDYTDTCSVTVSVPVQSISFSPAGDVLIDKDSGPDNIAIKTVRFGIAPNISEGNSSGSSNSSYKELYYWFYFNYDGNEYYLKCSCINYVETNQKKSVLMTVDIINKTLELKLTGKKESGNESIEKNANAKVTIEIYKYFDGTFSDLVTSSSFNIVITE